MQHFVKWKEKKTIINTIDYYICREMHLIEQKNDVKSEFNENYKKKNTLQ
jgi:hypothetical protein